MAELFVDPTLPLPTGPDGLPLPTLEPPAGLGEALALTRQAFSGLEDLPIDEPELEPAASPTAVGEEPLPPPSAVPLPLTAPTPDVAAMQTRLALMEAELMALRQPPPAAVPPPVPLVIGDAVVDRITERFQQNFAAISEQRAEESDTDFERRRARSFAETIVAAVYEDLLPTEAVQSRFQPTAERVARAVADTTFRTHTDTQTLQQQQETLVSQAVAAARQAGYDVHLPTSPDHQRSPESRLFWGAATQIDPQLPGDRQIAEVLALMPAKQPSPAPPPSAPRPQPMARQGSGPTPGLTPSAEEYAPMSMHGMLQQHARVSRIGGG